jgi:hypothetical protein
MRYLTLVILILAYALIPPAFAGPQNNNCPPSNPPGCGVAPGTGGGDKQCVNLFPTVASRNAATSKCLKDLTENAIFLGCLFEDDAGRAEDKKTALSCPARQAALAHQCQNRCIQFVSASSTCRNPNETWHDNFGDINGNIVGSARVDLCGPPLRNGLINIRKVRTPQHRFN